MTFEPPKEVLEWRNDLIKLIAEYHDNNDTRLREYQYTLQLLDAVIAGADPTNYEWVEDRGKMVFMIKRQIIQVFFQNALTLKEDG